MLKCLREARGRGVRDSILSYYHSSSLFSKICVVNCMLELLKWIKNYQENNEHIREVPPKVRAKLVLYFQSLSLLQLYLCFKQLIFIPNWKAFEFHLGAKTKHSTLNCIMLINFGWNGFLYVLINVHVLKIVD